jgi:hypothetical protein
MDTSNEGIMKKQVTDEDFIRVWNNATSTREAADALGLKANSARARAAKLRKLLGSRENGMPLIKVHPRPTPPGRKARGPEQIEALKLIAEETFGNGE